MRERMREQFKARRKPSVLMLSEDQLSDGRSGAVHGRPVRDTVTGCESEEGLSRNVMAEEEKSMKGVLILSGKHSNWRVLEIRGIYCSVAVTPAMRPGLIKEIPQCSRCLSDLFWLISQFLQMNKSLAKDLLVSKHNAYWNILHLHINTKRGKLLVKKKKLCEWTCACSSFNSTMKCFPVSVLCVSCTV